MKRRHHHNGFTLLELLVVMGVLGILIALLLPAIQAAREAARRMSCSNNFQQIGLAVAQYHDAFDFLPPHGTGTFNNQNDPATTNQFRLSFLVSITPFVDQTSVWKSISGQYVGFKPEIESATGEMAYAMDSMGEVAAEEPTHSYSPMGPAPTIKQYGPWYTEIPTYRCPSDPGIGLPALGRTNYAACLGDAIEGLDQGMWRYESSKWSPSGEQQMRATGRGMFVPRMITSFDDVKDGLSNTIMLGEIATDLGDNAIQTSPSINNGWKGGVLDDVHFCRMQIDPERPRFWNTAGSVQLPASNKEGRGFRWADAMPLMTGMNTILPPNSELCFGGDATTVGTVPTSSRHQGGTHVVMGDGAVIFMTDSVECGWDAGGTVTLDGEQELAPGNPSVFGLWGALGTKAEGEIIEEQLNQ